MSEQTHSLVAKRLASHPLIAQALAAVEGVPAGRVFRASSQIAARVYYPSVVFALEQDTFFATESPQDAAYEKALKSMESLFESLSAFKN